MNKTAGATSQGFATESQLASQPVIVNKKESYGGKNAKAEIANQLQEYIRDYLRDHKDLLVAKLMAHRSGMIINDIQIGKILSDSSKAKERYILILESSTFDPSIKIIASEQGPSAAPKESKEAMEKKMSNFRMQKKEIRSALVKKYRKAITDKILNLFEAQYSQLGNMQISHYFEMIQANFMQQCNVTKNWAVPRYFKFYFQLLAQQAEKSTICEHDIFVFI